MTKARDIADIDQQLASTDSPAFVVLTLTDRLEVENASPSIRLRETAIPDAQHRIIASGGALYIQAEDADGTTDGDMYLTGMNSQDARLIDMRAVTTTMTGDLEVAGTVTATAFAGDGSALTGVGASTTYGDVGTYVFGRRVGSASAQAVFTAGSTYAGSTLYPAGISGNVASTSLYWSTSVSTLYSGNTGSATLSGTWRAMGSTSVATGASENPVTLFVRIS